MRYILNIEKWEMIQDYLSKVTGLAMITVDFRGTPVTKHSMCCDFCGHEALVIFDDVFVPNDRIFMNGETDFAGVLVERFAGYHRQSYGGCKVGVGNVLIGAAALAADYNGVAKASHIKDKLIEMTNLNETLYSCGIACSC